MFIFLMIIIAIIGLVWLISKSASAGVNYGVQTGYALAKQENDQSKINLLTNAWSQLEQVMVEVSLDIMNIEEPSFQNMNELISWYKEEGRKAQELDDLIRAGAITLAMLEITKIANKEPLGSTKEIVERMRANSRVLISKTRALNNGNDLPVLSMYITSSETNFNALNKYNSYHIFLKSIQQLKQAYT